MPGWKVALHVLGTCTFCATESEMRETRVGKNMVFFILRNRKIVVRSNTNLKLDKDTSKLNVRGRR